MESEPVICVICNDITDEKTIKFTPTTLKKSKSILKIRKLHGLKYNDVSLPGQVNDTSGYHVKCYKNFLAVMKKYHQSEPSTSSNLPTSSSDLSNTSTSSEDTSVSEISDKLCVFCQKKWKLVKCKFQNLPPVSTAEAFHSSQTKDLVQVLKAFGDNNELYEKIIKTTSPLVYYHNSCKSIAIHTLQSEMKVMKSPQKKNWRYYHQQAFNEMKIFISEEVITKKRCFSFTYLCKYYAELLEEVLKKHNEEYADYNFSTQRFEARILKRFKEIKIIKIDNKNYIALKDYLIDDKVC
ncbi:hypothetical protein PV328_001402 [Microctonus aethiopoides]|uniref:Uncharacterized protein n=1 Tax=Microctonus aethiopoides TaxID=144406 RepID=A0AA39FXK2_9HYME|nr:hypothetical protein PV328_001402 [Microctonus aethiopoides]